MFLWCVFFKLILWAVVSVLLPCCPGHISCSVVCLFMNYEQINDDDDDDDSELAAWLSW